MEYSIEINTLYTAFSIWHVRVTILLTGRSGCKNLMGICKRLEESDNASAPLGSKYFKPSQVFGNRNILPRDVILVYRILEPRYSKFFT